MSTKSREVIFGSQIRGAKIRAERARERAKQAVREADRAEAEAWSIRMELRRPGNRTEGHRRAHNSECQGQQRWEQRYFFALSPSSTRRRQCFATCRRAQASFPRPKRRGGSISKL